jgi:hypothetical protein
MIMNDFFEKSPLDELESNEYNELVIKFCSLVCILKNKKMNYPSIFVTIISDNDLMQLYVDYCGFTCERDAVLQFLNFDESIIKSKFLKKVINRNGKTA